MFRSHHILLLSALLFGGCAAQSSVTKPEETAIDQAAVSALPALAFIGALSEPTLPLPAEDLWERIRRNMALPDHDHRAIKNEVAWYARHQSYLDRVSVRAEPYLHLIVEEVERRGLPSEIALLPVVESAFQPFAYSHGRAAGLWQFVPGTGRRFQLKQSWWYDGRRDIAESTRAALDYLEYLHGHFDGDWLLALAAYNSGEGTVRRAMRNNKRRGRPVDFWSLDLPRETRGYVPKLLAIASVVANPGRHDVTLRPIANEQFLTRVEVGSQIDLDLAAELAELSLEEIYRYNPAFNRWATDPEGPHVLLIPSETADQFMSRLAEVPKKQRIQWKRHRIRSGENLLTIATRYHTTVDLLKSVNGLRGHNIRAGDTLVIPVARKELTRYRLTSDQRRKAIQDRKRDGERLEYVVRNGDTLWDIAREFNVGVGQLASWNGMAPRDPLLPGRRLVIWTKDPQVAERISTLTPANFTHPYSESIRRRIGYTVRPGDSLARISQRFRVGVKQLMRWNNLNERDYLQPGQHLTLYVDVTRQAGI